MIPPGFELQVIFQVDAALRLPCDMPSEALSTPVEIKLRACDELPQLDPPSDQDVVFRSETEVVLRCQEACVARRSVADASTRSLQATGQLGRRVVLLDGPETGDVQCNVRITETEYKIKKQRRPPFYAKFRQESESVVRECFAHDWSRAKVGRLVPEADQERVCELLRTHYRGIVAIYRYMSTMGVSGDSGFGVSQLEAAGLMVSSGLGDDAITKNSDLDRLFITAKVKQLDRDKPKLLQEVPLSKTKPRKAGIIAHNNSALARNQFLEFLLRVANQRFVQTGSSSSMVDAVRRLIDAIASFATQQLEQVDAFLRDFHTEEVDDVLIAHDSVLQEVYRLFSGRRGLPGQPNFMSMGEFEELLETIEAYDVEFPQRRAAFAFRMGMVTRPDELDDSRFQEMSFLEFQHALGAVVFLRAGYASHQMVKLLDEFISAHVRRGRGGPNSRKESKGPNAGKGAKPGAAPHLDH